MDMQPRSLPTRRYTSRCYVTNLYIGKSVHLFLGQTLYILFLAFKLDGGKVKKFPLTHLFDKYGIQVVLFDSFTSTLYKIRTVLSLENVKLLCQSVVHCAVM
jgi:hypothetical protein